MKAFVKTIFLGVMLFTSQLSVADSGLSKDVPITVTVTAIVQEQISKLQPTERKRVEDAVKVGAAFMQQYLDGLACDTQHPNWKEEVGVVVAMDDYDWNEKFCSQENANWNQKDRPQACSQSSLVALQLKNGDAVLKYQMIQMGTLTNDSSGPNKFKSQGAGETKQLIVAINVDNRVDNITPKGWPDEIAYGRSLNDMKWTLRFPHGVFGNTPASIKANKNRYEKLIHQIEQQAAQICK